MIPKELVPLGKIEVVSFIPQTSRRDHAHGGESVGDCSYCTGADCSGAICSAGPRC